MSTQTKYFCDRCGKEQQYSLPKYSVRVEDARTGALAASCTGSTELCRDCSAVLLKMVTDWTKTGG
jgi:hypothetical protein